MQIQLTMVSHRAFLLQMMKKQSGQQRGFKQESFGKMIGSWMRLIYQGVDIKNLAMAGMEELIVYIAMVKQSELVNGYTRKRICQLNSP